MKKTLRPRALVHRACPLCLMARRWPGSFVARIRAGIAKSCPFCLAAAKAGKGTQGQQKREEGR